MVEATSAVVRADDEGLVRGDGCFEGCRLRLGVDGARAIDKLDAHLARFTRSASALDIPFDEAAWRLLIAAAVGAWTGAGEAALKLVLTRGVDGVATGFARVSALSEESRRQRRDGLRLVTLSRGLHSQAFRDAPWLLGGVKTLSYAVNMAAQREAASRGADDVVFVSSDGVALEAPTASLVWAVGRTLYTTTLVGTGILAGTTQQLLFDRAADAGWNTEWVLATVDDVHAADVVWLVSSVRGPIDVVELDGKVRDRAPDVDAEIRRLCDF